MKRLSPRMNPCRERQQIALRIRRRPPFDGFTTLECVDDFFSSPGTERTPYLAMVRKFMLTAAPFARRSTGDQNSPACAMTNGRRVR
jgi:hypothetical protein